MRAEPIGALRERLRLQTADPRVVAISGLTRSGTTATAVTTTDHGFTTGDFVRVAGADPTGYNGKVKVTVVDARTFTYACTGSLTTPATGTITVSYVSDAQGGRSEVWRDGDTLAAELLPIRSGEALQLQALQSDTLYRFRVRRRTDVTLKQRAQWTPSWPPQAAAVTLEINGVLPMGDGRTWMQLDCAVSPR